jgi:hypothetical protein
MTTRAKIAASALALLAASAAVAAAQSSVSGNAKAIAFDRAAVAAENRAPGYAATERGFITMRSTLSAGQPTLKLSWGKSAIEAGWAAVAERLTIAQQGGVTSWMSDRLTPLCTKGSACKTNLPAELLVDFYGTYVRFTSSSNPCFYVIAGLKTPLPAAGAPWWTVGSDFLGPPRTQGADTVVEYTYPFGKTKTAREADTIVTRTKAFRSGVVSVANGTRAQPPWAFTFSAHFTQLRRTPPTPKVTECE